MVVVKIKNTIFYFQRIVFSVILLVIKEKEMMAYKKELSVEDIESIKDTLDVIDISIYDLLNKRAELVSELSENAQNKGKAGRNLSFFYNLSRYLSSSVQKITEQRKYNPDVIKCVMGIINTSNVNDASVSIGMKSEGGNAEQYKRTMSNIRNLFPFSFSGGDVEYYSFDKHTELLSAIASYPNMLAVVPAVKTEPKDVWWISLISPDKKNYKIIGKVPFDEKSTEQSDYLIAYTDLFYGFDRSVIAIATSETITNNWLKTALHKVNIPLYRIVDSTAIFNGTVLHLIEISKPVQADDDIFKLNETINGINIRMAGYLGGYFLSLVDKDKILDFSSLSFVSKES